MVLTFAFSVHTIIDKIGTYAGFVAIVGLALFALLLFAQARELHRLRAWGAEAHDRMGELEQRLAAALELARRAGAAQRAAASGAQPTRAGRPVPQRPAAPARVTPVPVPASTSSPVRLPLLPAAPAGVGGPALASATVVVPLPATPPGVAVPAAAPSVPAAIPAVPEAVPSAPALQPAAPLVGDGTPRPVDPAASDPAPAPTSAPAPATVAAQPSEETTIAPPVVPADEPEPTGEVPASGNGTGELPPAALPPRRTAPPVRQPVAAARAGGSGSRQPARAVRSSSGRPVPAAAPLRTRTPSASPRGAVATPRHHARRRVAAVLAVLVAVVVAVVVVIALTKSGGGSGTATAPQAAQRGTATVSHSSAKNTRAARTNALPPSKTTVAVLNGTATPGLANTIANTLAADGYQRGPVGNASDHQRSVTIVAYTGGHQAEATEVAKALGVPSDAVQAIDAGTQASVCPGTAACTPMVVVTVGADRQR
jgi:hypothetical protein